jgi:hypothetical protein
MSTENSNEDVLAALEDVEFKVRGMIVGVLHFAVIGLPDLLRRFLHGLVDWVGDAMQFLARFSVRLARVLVVFGAWVGLVYGPLFLTTWYSAGWLGIVWMVLGIIGSLWGVKTWRAKRKEAEPRPQPADGGHWAKWKAALACVAVAGAIILLSRALIPVTYDHTSRGASGVEAKSWRDE